ncbi:hypothetical protein QC763_611730 [Podospora pseudopauciseta]|uniref:Uncharacterized protein n=1 Tax=Podospora pseudopauciseta TaxID=2093780 RepID=A0ABR0H3I4_9PEZI|nr:hypothetical protein QC763_611730 [Podospora pseudopauciseta]
MLLSLLFKVMAISLIHGVSSSGHQLHHFPSSPSKPPKMEMALSQLRRQVLYCHHSTLPGLLALLLHHSHLSRRQAQPQF